jgi:hypothetical protein
VAYSGDKNATKKAVNYSSGVHLYNPLISWAFPPNKSGGGM